MKISEVGDKYLLNLNLAQDPISTLNLKTLRDINGICDIERQTSVADTRTEFLEPDFLGSLPL